MLVLGIESSCDETSVAIVENGHKIISELTHSQIATHQVYGGVVPEIAAREHVLHIEHLNIIIVLECFFYILSHLLLNSYSFQLP